VLIHFAKFLSHSRDSVSHSLEHYVRNSNQRHRLEMHANAIVSDLKNEIVTPGSKVKLNAHSMCVQESSLHTYRAENGYRITNVTI
jgi:hypothetical protein